MDESSSLYGVDILITLLKLYIYYESLTLRREGLRTVDLLDVDLSSDSCQANFM